MNDDIVTMLRQGLDSDRSAAFVMCEAANEIERLRDERDEARRMVCEWHGGLRVQFPQDYAKRRGWDCYKEDGK